jgi:hypothetical protein
MEKKVPSGKPYSAKIIKGMDVIASFLETIDPPRSRTAYRAYRDARKACGDIINLVGNIADLKAGDMCGGGLPRRAGR